eukprot:CAMPEP_0174269356 /NCGR_PEP_ID=MMETSP0439-20130205/40759_1 /TAXON_ID=0 /ORGANISM="Stereomyxa ramosa, Strain Chinc5" /LENGTH=396 /DNA_ID=CAMNT_0015358089 /DNA_START=41 /DNA_END=1231 /DNA_ORIENTATION=+
MRLSPEVLEYLSTEPTVRQVVETLICQLYLRKPTDNICDFLITELSKLKRGKPIPTTPFVPLSGFVAEDEEKEDPLEKEEPAPQMERVPEFYEQKLEQEDFLTITPKRRMAICSEPIDIEKFGNYASAPTQKSPETLARLEDALKKNILFSHLEEEECQEVLAAMFEKVVKKGEIIIKQNDEGDNFYVVESGICEAFITKGDKTEKVAEITESGGFGELALIYGTGRAATVKALTDCRLWGIGRIAYRRTLMRTTTRKRKLYDSFLERVPILTSLQKYERLTVADALEPLCFDDGEVIIRQGDSGDAFYIIVEGEVTIEQQQPDGTILEVAHLYSSSYFGEIALLTDRRRAASVIAVGKCKCVRLNRDRFVRVMGPCEDILRRNMQVYNHYAEKFM